MLRYRLPRLYRPRVRVHRGRRVRDFSGFAPSGIKTYAGIEENGFWVEDNFLARVAIVLCPFQRFNFQGYRFW